MSEAQRRIPSSDQAADPDLIRAAQKGDAAAFAELVRRYQRPVHRTAYALTRNAADADDLAQECFVRAYKALERFRPDEPLMPWLSRIVTNLAFSLFRSRKRRPETPLEPLLESGKQWSVDDDPAQDAVDEERRRHMQEAFAQLKPEHQAVLTLRVVQDLSYEEMATTLGVPVGTVMSRLSRARTELKARLGIRSGES